MPDLEVHFLLVPHGAHFHRNPDFCGYSAMRLAEMLRLDTPGRQSLG